VQVAVSIGRLLFDPLPLNGMKKVAINRRAALLLSVLIVALSPAAAIANSGADQYCDPFGGCPGSGSDSRKGIENQSGPYTSVGNSLTGAAADAAAVREAKAARAAKQQSSLDEARRVLDAAGLSRLKSTLPRS